MAKEEQRIIRESEVIKENSSIEHWARETLRYHWHRGQLGVVVVLFGCNTHRQSGRQPERMFQAVHYFEADSLNWRSKAMATILVPANYR